jgi:hypothetical protein
MAKGAWNFTKCTLSYHREVRVFIFNFKMETPIEPPVVELPSVELPIGEAFYPIYQDLSLHKLEWLIIGALIFIAVLAWSDLILNLIKRFMTQERVNLLLILIYAITITLITIISTWIFKRAIFTNSGKNNSK